MPSKGGSIVMGLAYLFFVGLIIWFCDHRGSTFEDFSKYFGLFGTLVGVATGAIPGYFFKAQAGKESDRADKESDRANKEGAKAQLYVGALHPDEVEKIKRENPRTFQ